MEREIKYNLTNDNQEINFLGIIKVIINQKKIFLISFLFSLIFLNITLFINIQESHKKKNSIQYSTYLEIGFSMGTILTPLQSVKFLINEIYKKEVGDNFPINVEIDYNMMGNIIKITTEINSEDEKLKDQIVNYHKSISEKVIESHNKKIIGLVQNAKEISPTPQAFPTSVIRLGEENKIIKSPTEFTNSRIIIFIVLIFFISLIFSIITVLSLIFFKNLKIEISKS